MRIVPIALAAIALSTPPAHALSKTWQQKWDVAGRPEVRVVADDAHVTVHAGASGVVSARVDHELRTWGFTGGGPAHPDVRFERSGNTIVVTVKEHSRYFVIGGSYEKLSVEVTVPIETDLAVRTGDGAVDCDPVNGQIRLETGDGAIRTHGLSGNLWLSTGDGSVLAEGLDGTLRARSGDGRLTVSGRFDRLDIGTGDGRIDATARKGSQVGEAWNVESGDGSLTLRIPRDLKAFLDASTRDGRIHVDLPISVRGDLSQRELSGELNGGGRALRLRTADGPITLALAD